MSSKRLTWRKQSLANGQHYAHNPIHEMSLERALAQLEAAQLVRQLADEEQAYTFNHALFQETAYQSLLIRVRRELNRRVAEIYEQLYAEQLDAYASLLARYYEEAGDIGFYFFSTLRNSMTSATSASLMPCATGGMMPIWPLPPVCSHSASLAGVMSLPFDSLPL